MIRGISFALLCLSSALWAQSAADSERRTSEFERLRKELKAEVDRDLAQAVRALRAELHASVDRVIDRAAGVNLEGLLRELEDPNLSRQQGRAQVAGDESQLGVVRFEDIAPNRDQPSEEQIRSYTRLKELEAEFTERYGQDHPRTAQIRDAQRWHSAHPSRRPEELLGLEAAARPDRTVWVRAIPGGLANQLGVPKEELQLKRLAGIPFRPDIDPRWLLPEALRRAVSSLRAGGSAELEYEPAPGAPTQKITLQRSAMQAKPTGVQAVLPGVLREVLDEMEGLPLIVVPGEPKKGT